MHAKSRSLTLVAVLTLVGAAATAAQAAIQRPFSETVDLQGIDKVEIQMSAGSVALIGEDRDDLDFDLQQTFHTNSEEQADEMEESIVRSFKRQGDRLIIEIQRENDGGFWKWMAGKSDRVSFDATVRLPSELAAKVHTNGGNINALNNRHQIELRTNGGNIEARDMEGNLDAHTNGGNIRIDTFSGSADLHTNGGNIEIRSRHAQVEAHTNGGSITAAFEEGITGPIRLKTNGGSITARLPETIGFEVEAEATGGSVHFRHKGAFEGQTERNKMNASVNGGGPELDLRTSGGSIEIVSL